MQRALTIGIRASMLPGWSDCARRAAAKQWRKPIEAAGFKLNRNLPNGGQVVGTSAHKAVEILLKAKMETGSTPRWDIGVEEAVALLRSEVEPGCYWDDTTPNIETAIKQIKEFAQVFTATIGSTMVPIRVEESFDILVDKKYVNRGSDAIPVEFRFTGKIDAQDDERKIHDLKTGTLLRSYIQQMGGYILGAQSAGWEPSGAQCDYLQRGPKTKATGAPIIEHFPMEVAKASAQRVIVDIQRSVTEFIETRNPEAFNANPMSMMCGSSKYCIAFETEFCPIGRPRPEAK